MTPKQIIEMLKLLSKHFMMTCFSTEFEYILEVRLYPTDRYVRAKHKSFEVAFEAFCCEVLKHTSGNLHKEIKDILK